MLYVKLEACSAVRDTWKADSFELQVQPNLQLLDDDGRADNFDYHGFRQDCESDMMALCFLHEAMAMSRRSVETYARSGEEEEDEEDV